MADVTGPISSLPGSLHASPDGVMCDEHIDRPAVRRIQGETDSFGCEMWDLCQECVDDLAKERQDARNGVCDWCHMEASDLRPARDYDEGLCGRVYGVCGACIKARNDEADRELRESVYYDYYDEGFD
jgi:hypothetical protein